jgi:hypothetical protein
MIAVAAVAWGSACQTVWGGLPDPALYEFSDALVDEDTPGVIFVEEQRISFELGDDGTPVAVVTDLRQGQVKGEKGQWLRILSADYDLSFTDIVDVSVRTRAPDGSEKTFGRDKAQDLPAFSYQLYSDSRALVIAPPAVPRGSVVETRVVSRMKKADIFMFGHSFGATVPTKASRLIVEVPAGWVVETAGELHGEQKDMPPTSKEADGGVERMTWERGDIPGRADISRGYSAGSQLEAVLVRLKSWTDAQGNVHTGPGNDKELSKFIYELAKDMSAPTPAIEKTVKQVLEGVPADDARAKARKLYAWTRDNTRYCAVHVGLGGWTPHAADKTHELRYGDCKDKANLLHTMLKVAGVPSRPAAVYAGEWAKKFRLPVLGANFNHEILVVDLPGGPVVVDPTSRTTAFGDVPHLDEDRMMLPFSATGDALMATPASSPDKDMLDEKYELTFGDDGRARGTFSASLSGELSDDLREQMLLSPKDRHDDVVDDAIGMMFVKVDKFTIANGAPPEEPTAVEIKGELKRRFVRGAVGKGDLLLRASHLFGSAFPSIDEEAQDGPRTGPYLLGHRRTKKATVRLRLPSTLKVDRLPDDTILDSAWGSYRTTWRSEDNDHTLVLERTVVWKERVVAAADVDRMRAFVATALAADETPVLLVAAEGP